MKRLYVFLFLLLVSVKSFAFEIYALGTSGTNCRGVDRSKIMTVHLEELLRADGFELRVINGGIDGDKPVWMIKRVDFAVIDNPKVKLVIFEPGPNEANKAWNVEDSEKVLAKLQAKQIPTIYVSNGSIQTRDEAEATAKKYGAYYYGGLGKGMPIDRDHRQFDVPGNPWGGHMTALGCQKWAKQLHPLVKQVITELNIK